MNTTKTAINIILNIVSAQCEVPIDSILSNIKSDRKPENKTTKYARWLAHWLIYEVTGLTQKEVSRNMDRPNPSLIHTSIKRVRTLRDVDEEYRAFSDNILQL
ncbi:hypothetical protein KAR91_73655, partial [Candidatus Pacearchaeota archaeon]|nr:hypothetical protein [Candidatus Pacearchaeota archaeon]